MLFTKHLHYYGAADTFIADRKIAI